MRKTSSSSLYLLYDNSMEAGIKCIPKAQSTVSYWSKQVSLILNTFFFKSFIYPGILWFAPFVDVPAAVLPAPSITTIPET